VERHSVILQYNAPTKRKFLRKGRASHCCRALANDATWHRYSQPLTYSGSQAVNTPFILSIQLNQNPLKIDAENVLFFNIDFFGFWPRFWRVLGFQVGAKSAALLAAPGVSNPTAFFPSETLIRNLLRGGPGIPRPTKNKVQIVQVGAMLAPFSHPCRFFRVLSACWSFFSFFLCFGSLGVRFLSVQGQFWRDQNLVFRCFVARSSLQCEKTAHVRKPQFFLGFCMVFTHRKLCAPATKQCKIVPGACRTKLPAKIVLKTHLEVDFGRVWRSLGRHLAGFCSLLGGSWPLLGASWASLGRFLGALGCLLVALWSFRVAFWVPAPPQASILECLGTSQTGF